MGGEIKGRKWVGGEGDGKEGEGRKESKNTPSINSCLCP